MAKLFYYYGTMNSGKTLNMLAAKHNYDITGRKALILSPVTDTRSKKGQVTSRVKGMSEPCLKIGKEEDLVKVVKKVKEQYRVSGNGNLSVLFIDECQFLTVAQVDQLADIVDEMNIPVMAYGLKNDFKTALFPASKRLLEIADDVREVKTVCFYCGHKAVWNALIEDNKLVQDGNSIHVGDAEYRSVCRKCYKQMKRNTNLFGAIDMVVKGD